MAFRLDPALPLRPEIVRAAREQIETAIAASTKDRGSLKQRIHEARTRCKKVRALLKLVRREDEGWCSRENRRLGDAARALSPLRDTAVMLDTLKLLRGAGRDRLSSRIHEAMRTALAASRGATVSGRTGAPPRLRAFAKEVRMTLHRLDRWRAPDDFGVVVAGLRRGYARGRSALRTARKRNSAVAFHEWRKAAKAYCYQCQALRGAWPSAMKPLVKELSELGDQLGLEHDLSVFREQLKARHEESGLKIHHVILAETLRAAAACRRELRTRALACGERLFAEKPKAVAARISRWWRLARREAAQAALPAG
ncbi:MAG: hypothetical protein JWM88_2577 [Verrucomicrobia bacterium]|nr:hypothetical protein [Verrucomicrobiota bacterium]